MNALKSKRKEVISLPHRRNAIKALRQNKAKHNHNLDMRTDLKKAVKKFESLVQEKNKAEAKTALQTLFKKFDKAAKRNLLHKNTTARRKSRFSRLLSSIA